MTTCVLNNNIVIERRAYTAVDLIKKSHYAKLN